MLTVAPAETTAGEPIAWEYRQSSYAKGWGTRGPRPQLFLRLAEPWPCLSDVVPGLLPGPAVHGPGPGDAGRAASTVAAAGGRVDRGHGHLGHALHRHARVHHPR